MLLRCHRTVRITSPKTHWAWPKHSEGNSAEPTSTLLCCKTTCSIEHKTGRSNQETSICGASFLGHAASVVSVSLLVCRVNTTGSLIFVYVSMYIHVCIYAYMCMYTMSGPGLKACGTDFKSGNWLHECQAREGSVDLWHLKILGGHLLGTGPRKRRKVKHLPVEPKKVPDLPLKWSKSISA